eukprot:TRINITY_DN1506_c0_g1_i1.p1 TRINITY_DN1506_c0_g1~~TRINITY_DN1506_c0_g1_i1.p1  ORF type:complete len:159 (+),score=37.75 TRINITY_DN1506_c0_g1_i1:111-587(+)
MAYKKALSDEEIKGMEKAFQSVKSYKDGKIDIADYGIFLTAVHFPHSPEQLVEYQNYLKATNSDGRVSFEQFANIAKVQHDPKEVLKVYAKDFDFDKNGFISPEEFQVGIKTLHLHDPEHFGDNLAIPFAQFLKEADTNNDGKISIQELEAWLEKHMK